jgi:hypothetical protein
MDPLSIAVAASKLGLGFLQARTGRRQAKNAAIQANVDGSFARENIWRNAAAGLGNALVSSRRAGGFASGALSGGLNNLAADLRMAQFNSLQQSAAARAAKSAASLSLLGAGIDSALGLYGNYRANKMVRMDQGRLGGLEERLAGLEGL